jgi:hypothetical protein
MVLTIHIMIRNLHSNHQIFQPYIELAVEKWHVFVKGVIIKQVGRGIYSKYTHCLVFHSVAVHVAIEA